MAVKTRKESLYEAYGKISGMYLELPDGNLGYVNYASPKKDNKEKNELYGKIKSRYSKLLVHAVENGNALKIESLNVEDEPIKDSEGRTLRKDGKDIYRVKNIVTGYEFDEESRRYRPKENAEFGAVFKPYGVTIEFVAGKKKDGSYFTRKETVKPGDALYKQLVDALAEKGSSKFGVKLEVKSVVERDENGKKSYSYEIESIKPILREKEKEMEKKEPVEVKKEEKTPEVKERKEATKEAPKAPETKGPGEEIPF